MKYTNGQPSAHFSFSELNTSDIQHNDFPDWAILVSSLLAGLENTRVNYNDQPLTINSGYRSPKVQNDINSSAPRDRHIHGDAADLAAGTATIWQNLHDAAKGTSACVEPWQLQQKTNPNNPYDHTHADWRAVDHQSWTGGCPGGW